MKIEVEKVHQSASTPVYDVVYLVKITEYDLQDNPELIALVEKFESLLGSGEIG